MMVSDEEKRWIVVGIAMNKVAAPVLRDAVKQGMDANYANLDRHHQLLHPPCTLKTLTHGVVRADPILKNLKFQNINNNHLVHGRCNYNFNINSSLDLAKLYLPGHLAQFSGFDDSLDMTAILHLLGFRNYMPAAVFSPHSRASADDVRKNVRNKWGHVDVTEWTDALFNDCFDKLKTLVRSLGLTAGVEKDTLDQLDDWQTKGCQLIMGHAVDRDLLCLVQDEVKDLIKDYNTIHSQLNLHNKQIAQLEVNVATLTDQDQRKETRLVEHHKRLEALEEKLHVQQAAETRSEEIGKVLKRLMSFKTQLSIRLQTVEEKVDQLEQTQTKTDDRVGQLEQSKTNTACQVELLRHSHTKTADKVELLKHSHTKTADEVELLKHSHTKTADKVELLKHSHTKTADEVELLRNSHTKTADEVELLQHSHTKTADEVELLSDEVQLLKKSQTETAAKANQLDQRWAEVEGIGLQLKTQKDKPETSCMKSFDLNSCRSKLEDHYQKTATVPTSVWSKKSVVDIHQIYTRLSWVKEEQTPTGTTQSELKHYTELFTANKNGVIPKRILVQGQTGIGKSTFVKKLLVDWVGVNKGTGDEQAAVLKNFELVVAVNLKEVSKCQSLKDVITLSNVFAKEDKYMTEGLVDYITNNQEKVLLIFDGYDEYRCGRDSEIYEIFSGNNLRSCCVLITTRISKADELRGGEDLHAEIIGFSEVDRECFMSRFLNSEEVSKLEFHLYERQLQELAKVPLLLLFFCILWRKGQSKSFPKSKTTLYMDIIQFILNHSHSKQATDKTKTQEYVELKSFKEILSEIGKVALQGLLKDDHLFEYSQLSDSVRCDESVFIGLLQITEYSETSKPVGMVSFIHKSIQEFLAAWYITYRCVPKGGNLGEIGVKLEECLALENVFQFICGLSEDGAFAVYRHLKSVRISDPSLDLSRTVPDVESETDAPLSDVTERQWQFSDLVLDLFDRVESKADLSKPCLDCLGSVLPLFSDMSFPENLLLQAKEAKSLSLVFGKRSHWYGQPADSVSLLNKVVKMLFTDHESSEIPKVAEFLEKFLRISNYCESECGFFSVLCIRNGQVYFYITHLSVSCQDHVKLLSDNDFPSQAAHLLSGQLLLKFLKTLKCPTFRYFMKGLGAVIKHCNNLERVEISNSYGSLHCLLEQVPNPRSCSLCIRFCLLNSFGARRLASLLPSFETVTHLNLFLAKCSAGKVTKLIAAIKHKTLEALKLNEIRLTSEVTEMLCQSLPELSALRTLAIGRVTECSYGALKKLVAAIKNKTLEELELTEINVTSAIVQALGHSLPELSALRNLEICGLDRSSLQLNFVNVSLKLLMMSGLTEGVTEAVTALVFAVKHKSLEHLEMRKINLTSSAAEALRQWLPELSALRTLKITGMATFFDEAVARLVSAIKHTTLEKLELSEMHLTSAAAEALSQSLPELSALQTLKISGLADCSDDAVTGLVAAIKHKTLEELELSKINLTSGAATALGQSLPELSALRIFNISGSTKFSNDASSKLVAAIKHRTLEILELSEIHLTPVAAEELGQSLPELSALETLKISDLDGCTLDLQFPISFECDPMSLTIRGLTEYSVEAVTGFVAAIKHKTLEELNLSEINLTSAAAEALGRSLPELSALQTLKISGLNECSAEGVLKLLAIVMIKHKTLEELNLSEINLTSAVAEALGQLLPELSALRTLTISDLNECSEELAVTKLVPAIKHKTLKELELRKIHLTSAAAEALGRSLRELSALETLEITGSNGCRLQHEEMEALFGRFKRPSSLKVLGIARFSAGGSLAPLTKNLCFFPCLQRLELNSLAMCEADLCGLLENLKFTPDLRWLELRNNPLNHAVKLMVPYLLEQRKLENVVFGRGDCSRRDLNYVQKAVKENQPQLRILSWY